MRRCLQSLVVFGAILILVFFMLQITGDPAAVLMPLDASEDDLQAFRQEMDFDKPLYVQFSRFLFGGPKTKGVIRGDFGFSYRLPNTVLLAVVAVAIAIVISIPTGVLSAVFRNSWIDYACSVVAMAGQSMPNFWLGLLLILFFAVSLRWLPTSGFEAWYYIILPACTAGLYATARIMRMVRSQMLEVLHTDYVRTARAKGVAEWVVVFRHALKNAAIPVVTLVGLELGILLGGTVVTEAVFAWPGVSFLVVDAISNQDYPVVQAAVALLAFVFVGVNLVVDLLYVWLDPRISYH
jgi:ABC-type dipeptide/oligopeptide/nickel transport system permease component